MRKAKSPCEELSRSEWIKLVNMQAETIRRLEKRGEELVTKLSQQNPTERLDDEYSLKRQEQRK